MISFNNFFIYIIHTIGSLYLLIILLRFIFQLFNVDYYNPISQCIDRISKPLLTPLRPFIKNIGIIDVSALIVSFVIQVLLIILISLLLHYNINDIFIKIIFWSIIAILSLCLKIFFFSIIIHSCISWFTSPNNPITQLLTQICDPLLCPFRKILPNIAGIDISPIVLFFVLKLIEILVINNLLFITNMPQPLSIFIYKV